MSLESPVNFQLRTSDDLSNREKGVVVETSIFLSFSEGSAVPPDERDWPAAERPENRPSHHKTDIALEKG